MMLFRITAEPAGTDAERLLIEGRLAGDYVAEFQAAAAAALERSSRLSLDLSGVTFVDAAGVRLLRQLQEGAVSVLGCSSFVSQLLELR